MKRNCISTRIAVLAVLGMTALAPVCARADSLQQDKNTWRNVAVVGGVAALYGLSRHDANTTLIGLAGAAYAESQANRDQRIEDGYCYGYGDYRYGRRDDRDDRYGDRDRDYYNHGRR